MATTIYIVFLVINTWIWIVWQKRGTAKPKPAKAAATPDRQGRPPSPVP